MLVLSRGQLESCVIVLPDGREIEVKHLQIKQGKVRLGFIAPEDVKIHRMEVMTRIREERRVAAESLV